MYSEYSTPNSARAMKIAEEALAAQASIKPLEVSLKGANPAPSSSARQHQPHETYDRQSRCHQPF